MFCTLIMCFQILCSGSYLLQEICCKNNKQTSHVVSSFTFFQIDSMHYTISTCLYRVNLSSLHFYYRQLLWQPSFFARHILSVLTVRGSSPLSLCTQCGYFKTNIHLFNNATLLIVKKCVKERGTF